MAITGVPDVLVRQIIQDAHFLRQQVGINAERVGFLFQQHRAVRKVIHVDGVAGVQVAHVEQIGFLDGCANGNTNRGGASDAYLFSTGTLQTDTTSRFFYPAVNWLRADDKGVFKKYPNHWHFTATSEKAQVYRFATVINTHALKYPAKDPEILSDGRIKVGGWLISVNLKSDGAPSFFIRSTQEKVNITYKGEATVINEDGYETVMRDTVPELEI